MTLIDDDLIENIEQIVVPLDIVSGNGLGIRANNDVATVFIFDNIDSKTFDTMINLTYCYIMKISVMNISKCCCCIMYNPLGHFYDCF